MKLVQKHEASGHARANWRFHSIRLGNVGDKVFLLKQGTARRGIFGTGVIVKQPHKRIDDDGKEYGVARIEFDKLVDPLTTLLMSEQDTRQILPEAAINTQRSGMPIADESGEALSALIEKNIAEGGAAKSKVPTAKEFANALSRMEQGGRLSQTDREMLICNYNAPDHTLTGREMSAQMG